jgi:putative hydrolase of the HAD superfamily
MPNGMKPDANPPSNSIRAVFFDAVGTLIHPDPPAPIVYAEVGRRFGSKLSPHAIRELFHAAFQREELADRANEYRTSEEREVERWRHIVYSALDDITDREACFAELFAHFAHPESWHCDADAEGTLRELAARGYKLGLASNYDKRLRSVVAGLPALRPLGGLVISSEVGWRKPAPAFFEALMRAVAMPAEQILFVGDDLANDYEGARAARMRALLYDAAARTALHRDRVLRLGELLVNLSASRFD